MNKVVLYSVGLNCLLVCLSGCQATRQLNSREQVCEERVAEIHFIQNSVTNLRFFGALDESPEVDRAFSSLAQAMRMQNNFLRDERRENGRVFFSELEDTLTWPDNEINIPYRDNHNYLIYGCKMQHCSDKSAFISDSDGHIVVISTSGGRDRGDLIFNDATENSEPFLHIYQDNAATNDDINGIMKWYIHQNPSIANRERFTYELCHVALR